MLPTRREFVNCLKTSGMLTVAHKRPALLRQGIKAVAFDAFPILDPRPVFALVEQLYPQKGAELGDFWRSNTAIFGG